MNIVQPREVNVLSHFRPQNTSFFERRTDLSNTNESVRMAIESRRKRSSLE
jgi:hypothetical protein